MSKKIFYRLCAVLTAAVLFLQGCGFSAKAYPSVREISERSSAAGFLASLVEKSEGFISSDGKSDEAYLYDNAITLYALSEAGAAAHAEILADAIVYAQNHDRAFHDGRLRNVYLGGDPAAAAGRSVGGINGAVPLPGFWQNGKWLEDCYAVSSSAGNISWTVIALLKASEVVSEEKKAEYIAAADKAGEFLLGLSSESGGFTAGFEGWDDVQEKAGYKSTEHNLALMAAFSALSDIMKTDNPQKSAEYEAASESARKFIFSMYDRELSCFYTGTTEDGLTVNKSVLPLDTNALSVLAFGEKLEDADKVLTFIKRSMSVGAGFDFSAGDLDGVWNEGTAQMALCCHMKGMNEEYSAMMGYLKTQEYKDGGIPAADRDGVSTGFFLSGTAELWEYYNTLSIGATGWYALAQLKANPLAVN